MTKKTKKLDKKNILKLFAIIFTVVLPTLLLVIGVLLFYKTNITRVQPESEGMVELGPGTITPSQLLDNRYKYKNQKLTIGGRVSQEPMVCERKECPKEDPCCGCKPERNLIISDPETVIIKESVWRLRLLGPGGKAFCQRLPNSCQYDCPGWEMEGVYEVEGTFFAEPPPPGTGWRMYFDFYFEAEKKRLVKKTGITDIPKRFFKGIQETIEELRTSGHYVLP